jgi:hypothetical protein
MATLSDYFQGTMPDELSDMYSYLQGARRTPSVKPSGSFDAGTYGDYDESQNALRFDPSYETKVNNVLTHEYSHAANAQQGNQFLEASRRLREGDTSGPMDKQYADAFIKLNGSGAEKNLPPHTPLSSEDETYRFRNRNEAQAFGLGNMLYPKGATFQVQPHIDASAAQEQQIMMDLARRHALQVRHTPLTFLQQLFGQ